MAYLTCPDCMMPSPVADDARRYKCFTCSAEIVFETCGECGFKQSIPARWLYAFTCGRCGAKCEIPRQRFYSTGTRADGVQGYGYVYPRL